MRKVMAGAIAGLALIGVGGTALSVYAAPSQNRAIVEQHARILTHTSGLQAPRSRANGAAIGAPAIQPTLSDTSAVTSTFTQSDVEQYIHSHQMFRAVSSPAAQNQIIAQVKAMTSHDVSALLNGETTGLPDTTLVWYVKLQGPFSFAGPAGTSATYPNAVEVFDALTGNLVLVGGAS